MKTALIKTDFWLEDKIFELNSDTRYLYLALLTNPQRDITPAFKCSDRLLSAYTGYTPDLINICRNQLIKNGLIEYVDGYYVISKQDFVEPSKGRDTKVIFERYYNQLPDSIKSVIESTGTSTGTHTRVKDKDKYKDKDNNKDKESDSIAKQISEVIKSLEKVDAKNKLYYGNKTQRKACEFLIQEYGFQEVIDMIAVIPSARLKIPYFPSVTTPCELRDKWVKIYEAVHRNNKNNKDIEFV